MPLPEPAPRAHKHSRTVQCAGYQRDDGLWDIEGHMTDTKSYSFENAFRGTVAAGEPVHDMWLRLTVDDAFMIHDIVGATDAGPFAACPGAAANLSRLKGTVLKAGFTQEVRRRLGGTAGCTHLNELLGPMATTAMQTIWPLKQRRQAKPAGESPKRPRLLDSCLGWAASGDAVKQAFPAFYRPDDTPADGPAGDKK